MYNIVYYCNTVNVCISKSRGVAGGGGGKGGICPPPPFFPERQEFYLYLNELLPQIVDLVVFTLGKYTKAGNTAVLIADPAVDNSSI